MTYSKLDQPEALVNIFFPTKTAKNIAPINAVDIDIEVEDGIRIGCRFYGASLDAPNIIFYHGNGELVSDYDEIAARYTAIGINVFMTTYRGYGWSDGSPTVTNMYADATTIFDYALTWLKENSYSAPIFLMGRSLGSAPAIALAVEKDAVIKGLIIESGFADTLPLAKSLGLNTENLTEEDCFNNLEKIAKVKRATIILHGSLDTLIPAAQAENLQSFCGARSKQFQIIPGAEHNTMIDTAGDLYFETIKKFMDTLMGVTDWRKKRRAHKEKK
ncbi:MAG: lysophospholipase [Desulfotalea sp.]